MNILCVCLGNICRSPAAQAIFENRIASTGLDWTVDSAGTGGWHIGNPPDSRMIKAAGARGYDLTSQRARQVSEQDFFQFDQIFAMDRDNLRNLKHVQPSGATARLDLLLSFTDLSVSEVPDPYYGSEDGFDQVINLISSAADAFIARHI